MAVNLGLRVAVFGLHLKYPIVLQPLNPNILAGS
jgi:hypothetical protein